MAHAFCLLDTYGYRHTLIICNTYCFCTGNMALRTRLNAKFIHIWPILLIRDLGKTLEEAIALQFR